MNARDWTEEQLDASWDQHIGFGVWVGTETGHGQT